MSDTCWACPVCHSPLTASERSFHCANGHSFDRAKEGYVNLLLAHQKRSANPGDDRQMLRNRREFLEQGYYQQLAELLAQRCAEFARQGAGERFTLLDTGCGEGYYSGRISDALHGIGGKPIWCGGIDISREAIRMAARHYKTVQFAVASNAALPVAEQGMDCIVQVFAPGYDEQVVRALRPGGLFIAVTPGPRHLYALRQRVYDQPREHEAALRTVAGLVHETRETLDYTIVNLTRAYFRGRPLVDVEDSFFGLAFDASPDKGGEGKLRYWRDSEDLSSSGKKTPR